MRATGRIWYERPAGRDDRPKPKELEMHLTDADSVSIAEVLKVLDTEGGKPLTPALSLLWREVASGVRGFEAECRPMPSPVPLRSYAP